MKKLLWWHERVIYQIYPRSFCDSNNDGIGDIPGIITKLDYLKELGIGAIWISPVYKSPNADNGYDIADYRDINPEYGTLADMKALISEASKRDIKIIMDLVINHTSDEHDWFKQSVSPDSPYHDYYIWRPGKIIKGKECPPNNWTSQFTGSAWTKHSENGLYYLHLFSPKQPDLHYHNPKVIEEVKDLMRFWLDLGVAGFRCDVINMIYKTTLDDGKNRLFNVGEEHYLSQEGSHRLLRAFHDEVWAPYGAYTVGETVGLNKAQANRYTFGELETIFQFDHTQVDQWLLPIFKIKYRPAKMRRTLLKWQQALAWNTIFFENHDVPRSVSRFGSETEFYDASAKMLAMVILTLRGTPFIYQGEEIGQTNSHFAEIGQVDDVAARNVYEILRGFGLKPSLAMHFVNNFCRDHARTPMAWKDDENGGFSAVKPWQAVNYTYPFINVEGNLKDANSIWHFYAEMIRLRSASSALKHGTITRLNVSNQVLAFKRDDEDEHLRVLINLGKKKIRISQKLIGEVIFGNYQDWQKRPTAALRPFEGIIIRE